jgi:hypothetical protein
MAELSDKDMKIVRKHGIRKMASNFLAVYNKLCRKCQLEVAKNPREIYDNACSRCKPRLKNLGEKFK